MAEYKSVGIEAYGYVFDLTEETALIAAINKIETEVSPIDILINNAGIKGMRYLLRTDGGKTSGGIKDYKIYLKEVLFSF
nr:SDR family NAD(P)-dependent oxidoreductase [Flavobacterium aquiphilum]